MNDYGKLIEPPPISFHFGAPGWYLLLGLLITGMTLLSWIRIRYVRRNVYRKKAISEISDAVRRFGASHSSEGLLYFSNMQMKKIAMAKYGREAVVQLREGDWIQFLNDTAGRHLFEERDNQMLQAQLYDPNAIQNDQGVHDFVSKSKAWVKKHRRLPKGYQFKKT
jgi:hypothetical protein